MGVVLGILLGMVLAAAVAAMIGVSLTSERPVGVAAHMLALHAPEGLGLGARAGAGEDGRGATLSAEPVPPT